MPDATDPDSAPDASSSDSDRDWYVQQWNALCSELGTSDPNEVLARVQTLKRQMERLDEQDRHEEGLVTISEVEEVFRDMNEKIEKLRERNSVLAERLEDNENEGALADLNRESEELIDTLGVTTMDEAHARVQKLNERLETLYKEREQLVQEGLSDAEDALSEIDRLRDERDALRRERNQLKNKLDEANASSSSSRSTDPDTSVLEAAVVIRDRIGVSSPDQAEAFTRLVAEVHDRVRTRAEAHDAGPDETPDDVVEMLHSMAAHLDALPAPDARSTETEPSPGETLPAEAGDILGIRTVDDARELDELINDMASQLEQLREEHEQLDEVGLSVEGALTMIENMEAQLVDLYHDPDHGNNGRSSSPTAPGLDEDLTNRIQERTGLSPEDANDLPDVAEALLDQLESLSAEYEPLAEAGLDGHEAVTLIESMEAQLNDLYSQNVDHEDAPDRLAAIEEELGISTRREAEELSQLTDHMEEQLSALYQEKEQLHPLGLASIEDAVDMIESMEQQLNGLYEDKETLDEVQVANADEQSTFQQFEALNEEQQKLQNALGVASAEDVIEMVESLNDQLDDLYTARDAEVDPQERHDAQLWAPDLAPAPHEASEEDPDESQERESLTLNSLEHQLEALYREKEVLLHHGLGSADDAVTRLRSQRRQIDVLQHKNHIYKQRFDRLGSEIGTDRVPQIVGGIRALESEAETSFDDVCPMPAASSTPADYDIHLGAASSFVDPDTLDELGEMTTEELDALDVGAIRLNDDGIVEALNDAALTLPSLHSVENRETVIGKNFFVDLAPITNNNLFFGRFQKGQRRGELDARFPYTFTSPGTGSQSFAVHLYRPPERDTTWLLFRPA